MGDDRSLNDPVQELIALRKAFDDFKSTMASRVMRRPTGSIEATLLTTAPSGGLFMQGQTVSRSTYPGLWQWVQDNSLVVSGGFTVGDGSTTFGLPDFRGKVARGVASGETILQAVGSDSITLSSGQLPSHNHSISSDGSHGGHQAFPITVQAGSGASDVLCGPAVSAGSHSHGGATGSTGSGSAVDVRQASIAVNWLIYT